MLHTGDEPIHGYCLENRLGKGQFGEVWKASTADHALVALKFITLDGQGEKELRAVRRVQGLQHPHLLAILGLWFLDAEGQLLSEANVGDDAREMPSCRGTLVAMPPPDPRADCLVIGMPLASESLAQRLEQAHGEGGQGGLPVDELLQYMEGIAAGIDYLNSPQHQQGESVVSLRHGDIKPANLMLVDGVVKIGDFGVAHVLGGARTTTTGLAGSPAYMAPEVIASCPSRASDQYSLAITYVELRTGELPFHRPDSYPAVMEAHRTGQLRLDNLPPAEAAVIRRATALDFHDRFRSCEELVQALRAAVAHPASASRTEYRPQPRPARRVPLQVASLVAILLATVLCGAAMYDFHQNWWTAAVKEDLSGGQSKSHQTDKQAKSPLANPSESFPKSLANSPADRRAISRDERSGEWGPLRAWIPWVIVIAGLGGTILWAILGLNRRNAGPRDEGEGGTGETEPLQTVASATETKPALWPPLRRRLRVWPRVFISYRRTHDRWAARLLRDRLVSRFGRTRVVFDAESIPPGENWHEYLIERVTDCDVLVAVIGPEWLTCSTPQGGLRLDAPEDFLRTELEVALSQGISLLPVLVDHATMPAESQLPSSLRELAHRQATALRDGPDCDSDVRRIVVAIWELFRKSTKGRHARAARGGSVTHAAACWTTDKGLDGVRGVW